MDDETRQLAAQAACHHRARSAAAVHIGPACRGGLHQSLGVVRSDMWKIHAPTCLIVTACIQPCARQTNTMAKRLFQMIVLHLVFALASTIGCWLRAAGIFWLAEAATRRVASADDNPILPVQDVC